MQVLNKGVRKMLRRCDNLNTYVSNWSAVEMAEPDPIYGLREAFHKCKGARKVNLTIGSYRDDTGKPYVFRVVRKAEKILQSVRLSKDYAPSLGEEDFRRLATEHALGSDSYYYKNNLMATCQTLSRTGATRLAFDLIKYFYPGNKIVHLSNPTWGNHKRIIGQSQLESRQYRYFDTRTLGLDFNGLREDLKKMPDTSVILLHLCAHNPTGVDPNHEQWDEICKICKDKKLMPILEMGYHGYASGNFDTDAYALKKFLKEGLSMIICQNFGKTMSLYGEKIGALTVTTKNKEETDKVLSQLEVLIGGMYTSPPINGARIVTKVLQDSALKSEWKSEFSRIAKRLINVRKLLKSKLYKEGSTRNWDHIVNQKGMFCFTGLTHKQVTKLRTEHDIFIVKTGRISLGTLNVKNVDYVAHAIHLVTKY